MLNRYKLQDALSYYKKDFVQKQWPNEKYKWEAVKHFQDNWNINASDFAGMLTRSLEKTYNLLLSKNNFPAGMIEGFAETAPEEVRAMFIDLFDETKDVVQRILAFKDRASILLEKYGNGAAQHYQYENPISIYLWLRYPDKYYIYKFSEVKKVADELGCDIQFKKGRYADNLRNFYALYDELCGELKKDGELRSMLNFQITETCYPDSELKTLTIDVGFYISRFYSERNKTLASDERRQSEGEDTSGFSTEDSLTIAEETIETYSKEQFLDEVYITEAKYNRLVSVLLRKKNIILQGAPGVGKSFAAKRLAYSIMGEKGDSRIEFV